MLFFFAVCYCCACFCFASEAVLSGGDSLSLSTTATFARHALHPHTAPHSLLFITPQRVRHLPSMSLYVSFDCVFCSSCIIFAFVWLQYQSHQPLFSQLIDIKEKRPQLLYSFFRGDVRVCNYTQTGAILTNQHTEHNSFRGGTYSFIFSRFY